MHGRGECVDRTFADHQTGGPGASDQGAALAGLVALDARPLPDAGELDTVTVNVYRFHLMTRRGAGRAREDPSQCAGNRPARQRVVLARPLVGGDPEHGHAIGDGAGNAATQVLETWIRIVSHRSSFHRPIHRSIGARGFASAAGAVTYSRSQRHVTHRRPERRRPCSRGRWRAHSPPVELVRDRRRGRPPSRSKSTCQRRMRASGPSGRAGPAREIRHASPCSEVPFWKRPSVRKLVESSAVFQTRFFPFLHRMEKETADQIARFLIPAIGGVTGTGHPRIPPPTARARQWSPAHARERAPRSTWIPDGF